MKVAVAIVVGLGLGLVGNFLYEHWSRATSRWMRLGTLLGAAVLGTAGTYWLAGSESPSTASASQMLAELDPGDFPCDGETRTLFTLVGALPGERVTFDQSESPPIEPATADSRGLVRVAYSCPESLPRRAWTVHALSASSKEAWVQVSAAPSANRTSAADGHGGTEPIVALVAGEPAPYGRWYAVSIAGFAPDSPVTIVCSDSVDPAGFYTFTATTGRTGGGIWSRSCYSADGPEHWVSVGGVESNRLLWTSDGAVSSPVQTSGGTVNTWTDPTTAGGEAGPIIPPLSGVEVSCRVRGFAVANGNDWWYRIGSAPWSGDYFASADAFFNNGQTSGALEGTPFVDESVPVC